MWQLNLGKLERIDPNIVDGNLPMDVRTRAASGITAQPDHVALQHELTGHDEPLREVRVFAENSPAMINHDVVAVNIHQARQGNPAIGRGEYGSSNGGAQILSGMPPDRRRASVERTSPKGEIKALLTGGVN